MKTRQKPRREARIAEAPTPLAYSYVRFSTPGQAEGDSLRRQTSAAADWCKRKRVRLDTSLTLQDLGKSAYTGKHRENPDRHALAAFLKLVEQGRIPKGSYLVVENLDRLTREHYRPAVQLFLGILDAEINIVTTSPERVFQHDSNDVTDLIVAVVELARGNSESRIKSERIREAWDEKREEARTTGKLVTSWLPAWVELDGESLKLVPEKAAAIKRIFELAEAGFGHPRIVKTLTEEKVPPIGKRAHWARTYVERILSDRRVIGEYQPRDVNRKKLGEPILNYFPVVVTEAEFLSVQAGMGRRRHRRGRTGTSVNLFAGLIRDARGSGNYCSASRINHGKWHWILLPTAAANGRGQSHSFPLQVFERLVLSKLSEITVEEVFGPRDTPNRSAALAGAVARQEAAIEAIETELHAGGHVATLAKVLREMEARRTALLAELAEARAEEANPLAEQWGEVKTLSDALAAAPNPTEARLRLRSCLRRVIESSHLFVTSEGRTRWAAFQIHFRGGAVRSYILSSTPAAPCGGRGSRKLTPARAEARQYAGPDSGLLDLRDPTHVKRLEAVLLRPPGTHIKICPGGIPNDIEDTILNACWRAQKRGDQATGDWLSLVMLGDHYGTIAWEKRKAEESGSRGRQGG